MNKAQKLTELEERAKGNIEAMFLQMRRGREAGIFKAALEAAIEAAEALTRKKK